MHSQNRMQQNAHTHASLTPSSDNLWKRHIRRNAGASQPEVTRGAPCKAYSNQLCAQAHADGERADWPQLAAGSDVTFLLCMRAAAQRSSRRRRPPVNGSVSNMLARVRSRVLRKRRAATLLPRSDSPQTLSRCHQRCSGCCPTLRSRRPRQLEVLHTVTARSVSTCSGKQAGAIKAPMCKSYAWVQCDHLAVYINARGGKETSVRQSMSSLTGTWHA